MSEYSTKNYMEQGGDKWVIGGDLEFDKMSGGVLPNMATPASDANAAAVRTALIALITSMKDHGLMTGDAPVTGASSIEIHSNVLMFVGV